MSGTKSGPNISALHSLMFFPGFVNVNVELLLLSEAHSRAFHPMKGVSIFLIMHWGKASC